MDVLYMAWMFSIWHGCSLYDMDVLYMAWVNLTKTFFYAVTLVSIHQRHLPFLVIEILKSISQINPEFVWSFFKQKKLPYNFIKGPILNLPRTQSTYFGTNAVHFRGSFVWNNLKVKVKSSNSVFEFKTKIKNLGNIDCGCLICR